MPTLATKDKCSGCSACLNACAKGTIKMVADKEGFLQPVVNAEKCIDCGLCEKSCPVVTPLDNENAMEPKALAMWHNADRTVSSSGGAFSAMARSVLSRGGVVFGAAYDTFPILKHLAVDSVEGLDRLRGSKYMQSDLGDSFKQIRTLLNEGREVMFCGTPCQVAGLRKFLRKPYEGLLLVALACHGVRSNAVFNSYLKKLENRLGKAESPVAIRNYEFRRRDGWGFSPSISTDMSSCQKVYGVNELFMSAFDKSALFRESCYTCPYAQMPRVGDCSIADFWGIGRHGVPFKHDVMKGVSLILVNNKKGEAAVADMTDCFVEERTLQEALVENHNLRKTSPRHKDREAIIEAFLDDALTLDEIDKRFHLTDHSLKGTVKMLATKYGVFDFVKRIYNKYKTL